MKMRIFILASLAFFIGAFSHAGILTSGSFKFIPEGSDGEGNSLYVIIIDGAIAAPMDKQFKEALAQMKNLEKPLWIQLNSPGGSVEKGLKIIGMIKEEASKGRRIVTLVENGHTCASMCVPIFIQGKSRLAGEGSLFMFHGATPENYTNIPDTLQTDMILRYYVDAGINSAWLKSLIKQGVFNLPGSYWISAKELADAGAGVTTQLIPRHVKETPTAIDPNIRPR